MTTFKVLDLFSGIGGFSLGLERAGMETIAFCEIDPHAKKILKKHWPYVPILNDVCNINKEVFSETVDVICGGFPCQDLSLAGRKGGLSAPRSGLWKEMFRIISDYRPKYTIIENVANLLSGERGRWFAKLMYDLASIGYDAQWHIIPAAAVGAGHLRKRVWIVAYPSEIGWTTSEKIYNNINYQLSKKRTPRSILVLLAHIKQISFKQVYPDHRKFNGLPDIVDRVERLGNTVVPQIPEIIGRAIIFAEKGKKIND